MKTVEELDEEASRIKNDLSVVAAARLAVAAHDGQRYGDLPYEAHLRDVAKICEPYGHQAVIVAWLHDTLEDTNLDRPTIERMFGWDVGLAVVYLTDPPGSSRAERKMEMYRKLSSEVLQRNPGTKRLVYIVKAADRLANVRACVASGNTSRLRMYRQEHEEFIRAIRKFSVNETLVDEITRLLDDKNDTDTSTRELTDARRESDRLRAQNTEMRHVMNTLRASLEIAQKEKKEQQAEIERMREGLRAERDCSSYRDWLLQAGWTVTEADQAVLSMLSKRRK